MSNKKQLINFCNNNGGKPSNITWYDLAVKFNIKPEGSKDQRKKAACDLYRRRKVKTLHPADITIDEAETNQPKVLIFDFETTYLTARLWNTGQQYVRHSQLMTETRIITVAYKWLGEDDIHYITWNNKKKKDKKLIQTFVEIYNQADVVVGVNSDNFDCKLLHSRCAKYGFDVNTLMPKLDVQKQARKIFRLPSYSMKYLAEYFGVENKLSHEGFPMWIKIQEKKGKKSEKALQAMIEYNVGDIVSTEGIYLKLLPYSNNKIHAGVLQGKDKHTCPDTGSEDVEFYKKITTASVPYYILKSKKTGRKFKVSQTTYKKHYE